MGGWVVSVNSFADNIAAQIDPIRRAVLYLSGGSEVNGGGRPSLPARHPSSQDFGETTAERGARSGFWSFRDILFPHGVCCCARVSVGASRGKSSSAATSCPQQPPVAPPLPPPPRSARPAAPQPARAAALHSREGLSASVRTPTTVPLPLLFLSFPLEANNIA